MRSNVKAEHVPGKDHIIADTLSRHQLKNETTQDTIAEVKAHVDEMIGNFPITDPAIKLTQYETARDESMQQAVKYTVEGWPRHRHKQSTHEAVTYFFNVRNELSVVHVELVMSDG